jgi:adenylate kinase family enzyme
VSYHRRMADRVLIYGVTGSGKTRLARQVSERTGLPLHCVDDLTWEPGWVVVPADEQRRRITQICATDRWVLDHAYRSFLDVLLARADLVVGLDYPRWLSLARLIRRTLGRAIDGREICNGNTESFRRIFSRDSIIVWHFRSFGGRRRQIRAWAAAAPPGAQLVRLRSRAETRRWLASLPPAASRAAPPAQDPAAGDAGAAPRLRRPAEH